MGPFINYLTFFEVREFWAIYLSNAAQFQPAVTIQTFGHKYGGTIYAFLFTSDIVNNLMVATMSKKIQEAWGWLGLFLFVSAFGFVALLATFFFPYKPRPGPRREDKGKWWIKWRKQRTNSGVTETKDL